MIFSSVEFLVLKNIIFKYLSLNSFLGSFGLFLYFFKKSFQIAFSTFLNSFQRAFSTFLNHFRRSFFKKALL